MKKKKAPLGRRMKEFVKTSVVWGPLDYTVPAITIRLQRIIAIL